MFKISLIALVLGLFTTLYISQVYAATEEPVTIQTGNTAEEVVRDKIAAWILVNMGRTLDSTQLESLSTFAPQIITALAEADWPIDAVPRVQHITTGLQGNQNGSSTTRLPGGGYERIAIIYWDDKTITFEDIKNLVSP